MSGKSSHVSMRIDTQLKNNAESILNRMGISRSQAMKMLYSRIVQVRGWPCELKEPNAETKAVFEATDKGEGLVSFNTPEEFFADLHSALDDEENDDEEVRKKQGC